MKNKPKSNKLEFLYENVSKEWWNMQKHLLGKVLTIVDSSLQNPEQRKAMKDLVNNVFWGEDFYYQTMTQHFNWYAEATIGEKVNKQAESNQIVPEKNPYKE